MYSPEVFRAPGGHHGESEKGGPRRSEPESGFSRRLLREDWLQKSTIGRGGGIARVLDLASRLGSRSTLPDELEIRAVIASRWRVPIERRSSRDVRADDGRRERWARLDGAVEPPRSIWRTEDRVY